MGKEKKALLRIGITAVLYILIILLDNMHVADGMLGPFPVIGLLYVLPYLCVGWKVIRKAVRNIFHGEIFDENFLMLIASVGAFAVGEYKEAVAVMLFYQIGETFEDYAVNSSRKSVTDLMNICPEYANIEQGGQILQVDPEEVEPGSEIIVKPGERVPLDGIVLEGDSMVDTSSLTGESVPRRVTSGMELYSGCINGAGLLRVKTTKGFEDSTVSKILELVENASSKKARMENFITRFARYYTPIVVFAAVALAVIPSLLFGNWYDWLQRACVFLVISCPCALVISVPLSFFGGIGAASRYGILVKGGNFLEAAARLDTVVFDKTGTLTKGEFVITQLSPAQGIRQEKLLETAAYAELYSTHPVAAPIRDEYVKKGHQLDASRVTDNEEIAGKGVQATVDGQVVLAGNEALLQKDGVLHERNATVGTIIYVAENGHFLGSIVIADVVKPEAAEAMRQLKAAGIEHTVMLTGDRRETGEAVRSELKMDQAYTELLPQDKVAKVELLLQKEQEGRTLAFVGDGINDAPVLTRADVGIAMGSMGSDAAIEAADIVLMDDDTRKIAFVIRIARKTVRIATENVVFALGVKGVILVAGALGMANMWAAVFADVGVSILAILNSMRMLRMKNRNDC